MLADPTSTVVVVERQERATRCGFRFLAARLEQQEQRIEVVRVADTGRENLVADLVADPLASVSSCCARLYRPRRATRTSEIIVWDLMDRQALVVDERAEEREEEQAQEVPEDATR